MRELTLNEMQWVSGAGDDCSNDGGDGASPLGPIQNTETIGEQAIDVYEGMIELTSHIIERVAEALE